MPETTVFYGEFISLDNISGHGQKQYTNVTPENVFYDDTKACTLQGEISKKGKTSSASFERTFKDIKYFNTCLFARGLFHSAQDTDHH